MNDNLPVTMVTYLLSNDNNNECEFKHPFYYCCNIIQQNYVQVQLIQITTTTDIIKTITFYQ